MELDSFSLAEYLQRLASAAPTPGGGVAAAFTAAQATALLAMVCRLTLSKKAFANHASTIERILDTLEQQRQVFLQLQNSDSTAFQEVISTYRLPKSTATESESRKQAIQKALKIAAEVPWQLIQATVAILPLADTLAPITNPTVASDIAVARQLLFASLLAARTNVEVNLSAITDTVYCAEKRTAMHDIMNSWREGFLSLWP